MQCISENHENRTFNVSPDRSHGIVQLLFGAESFFKIQRIDEWIQTRNRNRFVGIERESRSRIGIVSIDWISSGIIECDPTLDPLTGSAVGI